MSLELPPDLEDRIKAQVESGQFETEEDVLRGALDALEKRRDGLSEPRQMVCDAEADVAAGRVGEFDAEETKRAVRERLRQHGITD